MLNKKLIIILLPIIFLVSIQFINAQEKPGKVKTNKMMVQRGDMQEIMNKIAADSTMRMQMIRKIMEDEHSHSEMIDNMFSRVNKDSSAYKEMQNYMRTHSRMKNMMQTMMNGNGMTEKKDMMNENKTMKHRMMSDSTMTMKRTD